MMDVTPVILGNVGGGWKIRFLPVCKIISWELEWSSSAGKYLRYTYL